jgi:hypothetical protein
MSGASDLPFKFVPCAIIRGVMSMVCAEATTEIILSEGNTPRQDTNGEPLCRCVFLDRCLAECNQKIRLRWWRIAGKLRALSFRSAGIAQLVEQLICNQQVVGSNPTAGFSSIATKALQQFQQLS